MKIWIDGYEANVPQRLGSSQVAFELINHLEKIDHQNDYAILLPSTPMEDLPKTREGWHYKICKPNKLWTRIALPLALYTTRQKPDLFFSPTHYIPRFSPVKTIVTIFDLSFIHFPEMFKKQDLWQLKNWTKFSILNSNHIVTISNFSKKDIMEQYKEQYKIDNKKITVTYPGYDSDVFIPIKDKHKIEKIKEKYKVGNDYIIYIGTIQPRKNLVNLIEAFSTVINQGVYLPHLGNLSKLQLVIVGKTTGPGRKGWKYEDILNRPSELGIENRVRFTGYLPKKELPLLLSGAAAFILPSLWEGFGIPVVEAMACGIPVIVSNVSSLPEVVGKAGLFIDPYSLTEIEQAIRTILTDKKLHTKLSYASLAQAKKFSWEKMAREVLKVFEEVNKG